MGEITVTSVKNSNIDELKFELNKRELFIYGKKGELPKRLIGVIRGNSSQEVKDKNANNVLSGRNPKCMIKETLNEEFTKQENKITKLINGNFQKTTAELKESQDDFKELKNGLNDFKTSLQFTEIELREKKV